MPTSDQPNRPEPDDSRFPGAYPPPGYEAPGHTPTPINEGFASPLQAFPPAPVPLGRRRRIVWWKVAIPVLVLLLIGGYVLYDQKTAVENASVGECLRMIPVERGEEPDVTRVGCDDPAANFVVTETGGPGTECDSVEASLELSDTTRGGVTDRLCLQENVVPGDCWIPALTESGTALKADCTSITNGMIAFRVLAVARDSADPGQCPEDNVDFYSYPERRVVICFGMVD